MHSATQSLPQWLLMPYLWSLLLCTSEGRVIFTPPSFVQAWAKIHKPMVQGKMPRPQEAPVILEVYRDGHNGKSTLEMEMEMEIAAQHKLSLHKGDQ